MGDDYRMSRCRMDSDLETDIGQLSRQPIRRTAAILRMSRIGRDAWYPQQLA